MTIKTAELKGRSNDINNTCSARDGKIKGTRNYCSSAGSCCLTFKNCRKNPAKGSRRISGQDTVISEQFVGTKREIVASIEFISQFWTGVV